MNMPTLPESDSVSVPTPVRFWRNPGLWIATVAVLLLGWQWFETRTRLTDVREELAKRLLEIDTIAKESRLIARQSQEALQAVQARVGVLDTQFAEIQGQQLALETMYQELSRTRDERLLAEIEQSVSIAAQQLQLAGNVEVALIALSSAEVRLARAAQPQFMNLRKLIVRDIERLKALPTADMPGLALKVEGVIAVVDILPLAYEQRPKIEAPAARTPISDASFWKSLGADLWQEIRQLIRIERIDNPDHADPALLSPSQTLFLRENLKLRLVNARLALLSRDGRSFRDDLRQSSEWLDRYFDKRAKTVMAAQTTLKALAGVDVAIDIPSLQETLNTVRTYKLSRDKDAPSGTRSTRSDGAS